jgi:hypothetical protein
VFCVGERAPLDVGDRFTAEVEFIGGPGGGELQLHRLLDQPGDTPS